MSSSGCQTPARVPTYNANCLAAQPDLAPCEVRRRFADESLGRVTVSTTLAVGGTLSVSNIILPGFAAAAKVCFRAVTVTETQGDPAVTTAVTTDIVRIAPVRLYENPDGSWSWARDEWTSEQASLIQATTGRCACQVACAGCVGPLGGWVVQLEHTEVTAVALTTLRYVLEYKAEASAPCCELRKLCGEDLVTPLSYGESPTFYTT